MVKFDLTQFDKNTVISNAKMELFVEAQPRGGIATARVFKASKEWNEMEATWFKASSSDWWSDEGGDYNNSMITSFEAPSNAVNKWQEFDVTDAIQEFIKSPNDNYGFHLYMNVTMVTYEYVSSESSKKDKRPKLTIEYDATDIMTHSQLKSNGIKIKKINDEYQISVPFNDKTTVSIYGVNGKMLTKFDIASSKKTHAIPLSLNPGIHLVKVQNKGKCFIKKLQVN